VVAGTKEGKEGYAVTATYLALIRQKMVISSLEELPTGISGLSRQTKTLENFKKENMEEVILKC